MSKRQLSLRSGVGYKTVCRICNGDRLGNLDTWMRFSETLGCSVSELIGDEDEERRSDVLR